jgi:hypothetical protein
VATNVNYEGSTYSVAAVGERQYAGSNKIDGLLIALAQNVLQKQGGNFTLAGDVNWGNVAGHVVKYLKSASSNIAQSGVLRYANNEGTGWRNAANSADLLLKVNASDQLEYNGTKVILSGAIVNADINAAAAIAYSKLNLAASIVNADVAVGAAIAYSKLALTGAIVNADVAAAAAIAYSKLATLNTGQILAGNGGTPTATTLGGDATIGATGTLTIANLAVTVAKMSSGAASSSQVATADGAGNVSWVAPIGDSSEAVLNCGLAATVAASALTIALKDKAGSDPSASSKVQIGFRNSTAATGTYNLRSVSAALSLVVPSGTTIGTTNGSAAYLYVYAIDNAGTIELAASLSFFDSGSIQNTSAISGGAAAGTLYSTTARTGVPVRLIGRLLVTEATAGTWATAPSEVSCVPFQLQPVTARYNSTATTTINTSAATLPFTNKDYDTTGSFNGTTGVYTCPMPGKYRVAVSAKSSASITLSTTQFMMLYIRQNSTTKRQAYVLGNGASNNWFLETSTELNCAAGDTIDTQCQISVAGTTSGEAPYNTITITRIA